MKRSHKIIAGVVFLTGVSAVFNFLQKPGRGALRELTTIRESDGMSLTTVTDPSVVFKKAFWRRPDAGSEILHAERREWSTASDGVRKWQWFIAVSPGPQLLEWLDTNPFSLAAAGSSKGLENAPDWFPRPSMDFQIQQNAEGHFTLMLSADRKQLFATDSGLGFIPPGVTP